MNAQKKRDVLAQADDLSTAVRALAAEAIKNGANVPAVLQGITLALGHAIGAAEVSMAPGLEDRAKEARAAIHRMLEAAIDACVAEMRLTPAPKTLETMSTPKGVM